MKTEEQIVYDLQNIISGGRVSADDVTSERLVRSFLRKYRASKMHTFFSKGKNPADYVFQSLGELELVGNGFENEFSASLPAIIHFSGYSGIRISKNRLSIPVLNEEAFELSLANEINKSQPKAKIDGNTLTVFSGLINSCDYHSSSLAQKVVAAFNLESTTVSDELKICVDAKAVLYDPSEALNYDWTKDPYPCPSEIIDQIETSTLDRDFELMIRVQPDQADNKSEIDNLEKRS